MFAERIRVGDRQKRRRPKHAVFDHAYVTGLLENKNASVRQQDHSRDAGHSRGDLRLRKAVRKKSGVGNGLKEEKDEEKGECGEPV